jgi:hypothetical protein
MTNIDENLRQQLLAMREEDSMTRERLAKTGELFDGYNAEMEAVHLKNAKRLEELIDEHGWLGISKVGEEGADAAWLIVQHAISLPEFCRKVLKMLLEAEKTGDVPPRYAAYLADRIAIFEDRPQRYGTQADWNEKGEMEIGVLENEEKVNEYRAEVGLKPLESLILYSKEYEENAPKDWHERRRGFEEWARKVGWRE